MKLRIGKYVLFFGKAKEPKPEPEPEPKLTREEQVRKWQREHKDQINARRKELYEQRKADNKCVKCGKGFVGVRAIHSDGTPYLMCAKCRKPQQKVKRGRGRPKGSKNKRKPGRPKGSKNKVK